MFREPKVMAMWSIWLGPTSDVQNRLGDEGLAWSGQGQIWLGRASFASPSAFVALGFLHIGLGRDGGWSRLTPLQSSSQ